MWERPLPTYPTPPISLYLQNDGITKIGTKLAHLLPRRPAAACPHVKSGAGWRRGWLAGWLAAWLAGWLAGHPRSGRAPRRQPHAFLSLFLKEIHQF